MLGDDSCPRLSPHRGFRVRACCYSFPSSGWRARAQALILRRREAAAPLPAEAPATERLRPRERRVSEQPPPVLEPPEPPFTLRPLCATRRALPNYVTAHNKPAVTLPTRMPLGQVKGASWSSGNGEPRGSHLRPSHRIAESLRETALGQPWLLRTAPLVNPEIRNLPELEPHPIFRKRQLLEMLYPKLTWASRQHPLGSQPQTSWQSRSVLQISEDTSMFPSPGSQAGNFAPICNPAPQAFLRGLDSSPTSGPQVEF
ncbi:uncharacterized protein LOC118154473 isoform X3 [Callithrix jacchus]|uniref:uncharacterized protein LOC118154473 isoform X4 n=1 Tax=Callithrix jacchus TaxID=9483 RepID=UPI0004F0A4A9|nr:uncharacterized protein LOC118154473 isoform X4 [Callithrix jacchus]